MYEASKGKEHGLVLDNAGVWIEHGLSYIDREWTLKGVDSNRKRRASQSKLIAKDEDGILREINHPLEAEGLELLEINEELERLLVFENYLQIAKQNGHKLISAIYRYSDYLISKKLNYSDVEIDYCYQRINREGVAIKKGFWYYRKNEIERVYKSNINEI